LSQLVKSTDERIALEAAKALLDRAGMAPKALPGEPEKPMVNGQALTPSQASDVVEDWAEEGGETDL
jgi:hypothetical protein